MWSLHTDASAYSSRNQVSAGWSVARLLDTGGWAGFPSSFGLAFLQAVAVSGMTASHFGAL